jgi:hypothetical protein
MDDEPLITLGATTAWCAVVWLSIFDSLLALGVL